MAKQLTRSLSPWLWLTVVILLNTLLSVNVNANDQCFSQHRTPYENYNSCCSRNSIGGGSANDVQFTYECDSYATPYGVPAKRSDNIQDCASICANDNECVAGAWDYRHGQCYLTSKLEKTGLQRPWVLLRKGKDSISDGDCQKRIDTACRECKQQEATSCQAECDQKASDKCRETYADGSKAAREECESEKAAEKTALETRHEEEKRNIKSEADAECKRHRPMKIDATYIDPIANAIYAFSGTRYVRIMHDSRRRGDTITNRGPLAISNWRSLSQAEFSKVDAALPRVDEDGVIYFFSGDKYVKVRVKPGSLGDGIVFGPARIRETWKSLDKAGFDTVDAVMPVPGYDGQAYVFSGARYARIHIVKDTLIYNPGSIHSWKAVMQAGFDSVDTILPSPDGGGQTYFFKGNRFIRVKVAGSRDELEFGPAYIVDEWASFDWVAE